MRPISETGDNDQVEVLTATNATEDHHLETRIVDAHHHETATDGGQYLVDEVLTDVAAVLVLLATHVVRTVVVKRDALAVAKTSTADEKIHAQEQTDLGPEKLPPIEKELLRKLKQRRESQVQ